MVLVIYIPVIAPLSCLFKVAQMWLVPVTGHSSRCESHSAWRLRHNLFDLSASCEITKEKKKEKKMLSESVDVSRLDKNFHQKYVKVLCHCTRT